MSKKKKKIDVGYWLFVGAFSIVSSKLILNLADLLFEEHKGPDISKIYGLGLMDGYDAAKAIFKETEDMKKS